jgi:hypothetical protein
METRTAEEIRKRKNELNVKIQYLREFLSEIHKGSNYKQNVEKELKIMIKQSETLDWVLKDEDKLPF